MCSEWNKANLRNLSGYRPSDLTQIGFKSWIFQPMWAWNLTDDLENQYGTSFILCQAFCIITNPSVNSNWSYSSETLNLGKKWQFFVPCYLEIWWRTSKNNRHLFYAASSFVYHFIAIGEFKLELQLGNAQFGSKPTNFLDVWPWNFMDDLEKQ